MVIMKSEIRRGVGRCSVNYLAGQAESLIKCFRIEKEMKSAQYSSAHAMRLIANENDKIRHSNARRGENP